MTKTITIKKSDPNDSIHTPCMICGSLTPLEGWEETAIRFGHMPQSKICDDCKDAILVMKKFKNILKEENTDGSRE